MPKMKTKKSLARRYRLTATGKLKHNSPGKRHLLTHKTGKRKRQLCKPKVLAEGPVLKTYKRLMGVS
ncbi:MAG: 50S ribosomal protein L35 [Chlamydiia bacterium]|nr:50S ribosomal protein L35 [Chlamydiia bacterium]